jgi:hypothetical protein
MAKAALNHSFKKVSVIILCISWLKERDILVKELDARPKELDTRLKEIDARPKELDIRLKEIDTRPKELDIRPKEIDTRLKELDRLLIFYYYLEINQLHIIKT